MKRENVLFLFFLSIFVFGCSSNKQSHKELPCLVIGNNYPEKEIILTDIADVTYLCLNSDEEDYLYGGGIVYVTQNTIIVNGNGVLFFSKDGKPRLRFNRSGQGPEEYYRVGSIMYEETTDDVYMIESFSNYIK